jgi:hypothetical protein
VRQGIAHAQQHARPIPELLLPEEPHHTQFLRRVLTVAVLRTPFHIRPWIRIRPHTSTKGVGYMAWGYTKMNLATGIEGYRERAPRASTGS